MTHDKMPAAAFEQVREALECRFDELARMHDKALDAAVAAWPKATGTPPQAHYQADLLKAVMFARFPEAARAWFNE